MVLCNITKWIKDDIIHVDISQCNLTVNDANTTPLTSATSEDDGAGSVKFTVAVVIVYGIAAMGVLALGFFSRRKRHKEVADKMTSKFIKNYDEVRFTFDKKTRVGAVTSFLQSIHGQPSDFQLDMDHKHERKASLFHNLAFLALPLTNIREDDENTTSDDGHYIPVNDKDVIFTVENDVSGSSTIGSILSDEMTDKHSELSIDDLCSVKDDLDAYSDNKQDGNRFFEYKDSYGNELANGETVKLLPEHNVPSPSAMKVPINDHSITDSEEYIDKLISHNYATENETGNTAAKAITDSLLSETEIDKLIKDLEAEIAVKRNLTKASSHSDSIIQEDPDHLEDDVFVDEKNVSDGFHDIDICTYPARDHSPDWVDLSKEKFFNTV